MKKLFISISLSMILCLVFLSCNNIPRDTDTNTGEIFGGNLGNDVNSDDTSIKVEYDEEREANDSEFPFDNIVIERNGYDLVAGGRYYGDDFDNVKYYGSYYRIIDNYSDFSELTQWGNDVDESVFNNNFVLVLHLYEKCSVYYSHPEFYELNIIGRFFDFKFDVSHNKICITESRYANRRIEEGVVPPKLEDYTVVFPTEKQETIYLLIPKDEMPSNLPINGEISFYEVIEIAE